MTSTRLAASLCFLTSALWAAQAPSPAILVLSKGDHGLMIVSPSTRQVVAQVPSGPDPHEVVASADGRTAYISNYGGGAYNTITVVDLVHAAALPVIDLGPLRGPHGLVFEGGKLWFTAEGAKVIGSYDPTAKKVDWVLGTGQDRTHMIFVFPDLERIITSNVSSATMTLIGKSANRGPGRGPGGPPPQGMNGPGGPPPPPPPPNWEETVVPVGKGAEGFDVSPDGKQLWAANAMDGTISVLDLASKKVVETIDANVPSANRLKFTPDGTQVLVSTLRGNDLVVFDVAQRKESKRVKIGTGAAGILMQPDGSVAYVACTPDDYVAVVDLKSLAVKGHISAGKQPDGLAWAVRQ